MSTDRGHPVGIPPIQANFGSLKAEAQAVIAAMIADVANAPGVVRVVRSTLIGDEDGDAIRLIEPGDTPEGFEFVATDIVFRSIGNMAGMAGTVLNLYQQGSFESDPVSTRVIDWNDLNLVPPTPSGSEVVERTARISLNGSLDGNNRRGFYLFQCDQVRPHPFWIDLLGYFVETNIDE